MPTRWEQELEQARKLADKTKDLDVKTRQGAADFYSALRDVTEGTTPEQRSRNTYDNLRSEQDYFNNFPDAREDQNGPAQSPWRHVRSPEGQYTNDTVHIEGNLSAGQRTTLPDGRVARAVDGGGKDVIIESHPEISSDNQFLNNSSSTNGKKGFWKKFLG